MQKTANIPQRIIHFRRWSRKGYAIFASLGQCVSVRQLTKSVTEASLKKQRTAFAITQWNHPEEYPISSDEEESTLWDSITQLLLTLLQPQTTTEECSNNYSIVNSDKKKAGQIPPCIYPAFSLPININT